MQLHFPTKCAFQCFGIPNRFFLLQTILIFQLFNPHDPRENANLLFNFIWTMLQKNAFCNLHFYYCLSMIWRRADTGITYGRGIVFMNLKWSEKDFQKKNIMLNGEAKAHCLFLIHTLNGTRCETCEHKPLSRHEVGKWWEYQKLWFWSKMWFI